MRELTSTSYAILGLLAVRPWTTYELAVQMERAMAMFWPRAASKLYEEPKNLVAHGLAAAKKGATGKRPKTVYSITAKGRKALRRWLEVPGEGPTMEFEGFLKFFFAEQGGKDAILANLAAMREWARDNHAIGTSVARDHLEGESPFPHRLHVIALVFRFLWDFATLVEEWAAWAETEVAAWPDPPVEGPIRTDVFENALRAPGT